MAAPLEGTLNKAHRKKGDNHSDDAGDIGGGAAAATLQCGLAPSPLYRCPGPIWERAGFELPDCLNSGASGSWNSDQWLAPVSQVAPQTPILPGGAEH